MLNQVVRSKRIDILKYLVSLGVEVNALD
ncbi:hypothetical protein [Kordia sp.]